MLFFWGKPPMNVFNLFIKQVSVIKPVDHPEHSSLTPRTLLFNSPRFLFLSTKSCDILCIFKQLIRVLLCFYSHDYDYCRFVFSLLLFEKELLPKDAFFCNGKKTIQYAQHTNAPFLQCLSYDYKRTQTKKLS